MKLCRIARQIADALEAAHEQGIIHRDLKPANVKVRDDGMVRMLDFGLAKALAPEGDAASEDDLELADDHRPRTALGMILGTAAYMAPEQAKGRAVHRQRRHLGLRLRARTRCSPAASRFKETSGPTCRRADTGFGFASRSARRQRRRRGLLRSRGCS